MASVTQEPALQPQHAAELLVRLESNVHQVIVGKSEVGQWVQGYFEAFHTQWVKTTIEFVVQGDLAYEWYTYQVTDTPRDGGDVTTDSGNGINIYRRGADGTWRVSRDAWATDRPAS